MSIFVNKKEFSEKKEILDILEKLEIAHKNKDELMAAILLTKLAQKNIKIEAIKQK